MVSNSPKVSVLYCGAACVLKTRPHFYQYHSVVVMASYRMYEKASCCGGCELTLSDSIILTGNGDKLLKFSYDHRLLPKMKKCYGCETFMTSD